MEKYHWGILGTGWIASEMAEALMAVHGEIYAVCGTSMEKAERFASGFQVRKCYADAMEMIHDEELDILYVATPHSHHHAHTALCLAHGKHVLALCGTGLIQYNQQLEEMLTADVGQTGVRQALLLESGKCVLVFDYSAQAFEY